MKCHKCDNKLYVEGYAHTEICDCGQINPVTIICVRCFVGYKNVKYVCDSCKRDNKIVEVLRDGHL